MDLLNKIKKLFGDSWKTWKNFASENGGEYIEGNEDEHLFPTMKFEYNGSIITFNSYSRPGEDHQLRHTRCFATLPEDTEFSLHLSKEVKILSNMAKMFGAQDIQIGHEKFDKKYMIKANSRQKAKEFLNNDKIQAALLELNESGQHYIIGKPLPSLEDKKETDKYVSVEYSGFEKDDDVLKLLLQLMKDSIDEL